MRLTILGERANGERSGRRERSVKSTRSNRCLAARCTQYWTLDKGKRDWRAISRKATPRRARRTNSRRWAGESFSWGTR